MIARIGIAFAVVLLLSFGTIGLWNKLKTTNEAQIARIVEAESYAARSQLIRNVDAMLAALKNVRAHWSAFGHLSRDQWASDAVVELEHFKGIRMIVWDDPKRDVRYVRTAENPRFDYRPDDDEWQSYTELLSRARGSQNNSITGPLTSETGDLTFEVAVARSDDNGVLAAIVDIDMMFDAFLEDESPGFAVRIKADDVTIFERGEAAPDLPENWVRGGLIRSSFGSIWMVEHRPTAAMLKSLESPAIEVTLLLGLVVSVLLATLIFENGRARSRAHAAEVAESKVVELNRGLEQTVIERTDELAKQSADLQMLADSVAHDLRNPLNAIAVNVELLKARFENELGDDGKTILTRLSPCVHQMTTVLDRLIGLSRIANSTFQRQRISMRTLVTEIFDDLNASEPLPPVTFSIEDLPDADADEKLVSILYLNLLGNALKYSRDTENRVIRAHFDFSGTEVVYCVSDNGIGFDDEMAEKIFAAFTQISGHHNNDGVGLGLTLAKNVVARHGGRIWAKGVPGQGATFYFTLGKAS